jgi:hypothetical protein
MRTDFRKPLLRISLPAGILEPVWEADTSLRTATARQPSAAPWSSTFRHTQCCARLATLDPAHRLARTPLCSARTARRGVKSTGQVTILYGLAPVAQMDRAAVS